MKIMIVDNDGLYSYNCTFFVEKALGNLVLELIDYGHEIELFQIELKGHVRSSTFSVSKHKIIVSPQPRYSYKIITYISAYTRALFRIYKNDFVYLYYPSNFKFLAIICFFLGKEYGLNVRGEEGIWSFFSKFIYKRAKVICTVSELFTERIRNIGARAFTQKPHISFDYRHVTIIQSSRSVRNKGATVLLYIGRLDIEKGLIELLSAVKNLTDQNYKVILNIIGDGPDLQLLNEEINRLNLFKNVNLFGPLDDQTELASHYCNADIFVLPSYHEGFPRVVYEAMICGILIVTTVVGGMGKLMQDRYNCIAVNPRSKADLFNKLKYALDNFEELGSIAENGYKTVRTYLEKVKMSQAEILSCALKN